MAMFQQLGLDRAQSFADFLDNGGIIGSPNTQFGHGGIIGSPNTQFSRQGSSAVPSLDRPALDGLPSFLEPQSSFQQSNITPPVQAQHPLEAQVFYICAKALSLANQGDVGFPAYSEKKTLVGFYEEIQDQTIGTQVVFRPLDQFPSMSAEEVKHAENILNAEIQKDDGSVVSIVTSQNDLERLKEDAMMYHWTNSMATGMVGIG
eukprot:CAMPEP_0117750038 /NCGR_PEP_ID=MMETSP0947-20121206/10101_1 /TAXON_ID=44440 /ORGANISM="Chattonella subsalsa, Strain CCMP2191" /LENGTH=204 /DNA_ID=CAMNT_0005568071 /DNA_START=236 /DNA_END=850 /DNA_ORIENTATION=-